ncbi:glycoside hydrolase family 5 protein [Mycolicibacterium rutilum]|uniref:glycoside hydrolase family 5 protein n=1 Tax=Mycolicibacterium rutilum TaxID=370526 RepID=UPI00138FE6DD|nr:cellulase family glycosylhydrolase [Mycolicibacterium rutilum]
MSYSYVPAAVINDSNDTIGIADSDIYGLTRPDGTIDTEAIDRHLEEMQKLGVNTVRVLIPWADIQPVEPGTLPPDWEESLWNRSEYIINAAADRGMAVLGVLNTTPSWGDDPEEPGFGIYTPPDPELYGAWAATVAERYKGLVSAYEIWNEPNYTAYWTAGPDPEHYTEILRAAYDAIDAIDPDALVVAGVLGTVQDSGLTMNPVTFVERMYAAGAKGYFDALSIHPYNNEIKFSDGLDPNNLWQTPVEQLIAIRQQMIANGDDALKIWATEYGLSTYIKDEETQAAWVKDFLDYWGAQDYTGPAFLFTLRDRLNSTTEEGTMGIFTYEWGRKLVADVIECATTGRKCPVDPGEDPVVDPVTALVQAVAAVLQQVYTVVAQTVTQLANAVVNVIADALRNLFGGLTNPATASLDVPADTRMALAGAVTTAAEDVTGEPIESSLDALDNPVTPEAPEAPPAEVTEPAAEVPPVAEEAPVPTEEVPTEEVPAEEVPAEEVPAEEVPAEEVPVEEVPAEEVPVDEVPVEETPEPVEAPAPTDEEEQTPAEDEDTTGGDEDETSTGKDDSRGTARGDDDSSDDGNANDTKDGNKATPGTGGAGNGAGTGSPGSNGPGSGGAGAGGADSGGDDSGGSGGNDSSGGGDKSGGSGSNVSYVQGPWGMLLAV